MFTTPIFMTQMPYQQNRTRRNRNRRKDITFEEIREFRRFLKEMHEEALSAEEIYKSKYKAKEEKKEEKKKAMSSFETALILTLLSPVIGLGVINLYVYMYHAMQVAIKGLQ